MADNGTSEGGGNGAAPGLLSGLQVLDFSQFAFGPVATRLLADLGADVIKVEPLEGDFSRLTAEPWIVSAGSTSTTSRRTPRARRSSTSRAPSAIPTSA